ncbi:hypothetical protein ACFWRZ_09105 [Streptomyces rubiginosohelvolus]|uniref:hypothetical protein n=1 Tax=Streptomyces rubiginosohelvolus TaxID=67362 RepID=UPI00365AF7B2
MSVALSAPSVRPALFPPPSVPLRFTDGDRYEWTHTRDVWTRTDGLWVPSSQDDPRDDGTGTWTDAEVSACLSRAVEGWDARQRFVPAQPGHQLPGRPILGLPTAHNAAQYVLDHQDDRLVPVRDLVAAHDEDAAYDVPGVITAQATARVLSGIVTDHGTVRVRYDESAGRIYARYQRPNDVGSVLCLHVFVLTEQGA